MRRRSPLLFVLILSLLASPAAFADDPGLTYTDLMQVRKVYGQLISDDGRWIALEARPGRGDGEVIVRATRGGDEHRIERGQSPALSTDGEWAAAMQLAPFAERETAEDEEPDPGAVLLRTDDGETWSFERVKSVAFSDDGTYFAVHFEEPEDDEEESGEKDDEDSEEREAGTQLLLVRLADLERFTFENVSTWSLASTSDWLALSVATADGAENRLELLHLGDTIETFAAHADTNAAYPAMAWAKEDARLAFLLGDEVEAGEVDDIVLRVIDPDDGPEATEFLAMEGWQFPPKNALAFSRDGDRVFVGLRPADEDDDEDARSDAKTDAKADDEGESEEEPPFDPYDFDTILEDRGVDVWHWDDSRIKSNARAEYEEDQAHLYRAVAHVATGSLIQLADEELDEARVVDNPHRTLATTDHPYRKLRTWDGFYSDAYVVDLETGARRLVVEQSQDTVALSPQGRFVAYYRPDENGQWWLYDTRTEQRRQLEAPVPFADEDHDYPRAAPGYGIGGWATDDSAVLVYDKYDVWRFDTATGEALCITEGRGRRDSRTYRVHDLDPEKEGFDPAESLLVTGFDERRKNSSFWRARMNESGLEELRQEDKRFDVLAKAENADVILYTEERYDEFPDLWVADSTFRRTRKLTEVNPQLENFDLGEAELVEWKSADGIPLQGILIKPANYDEGRRYPVLVYFYRFFSQRLHNFNDPEINHRPSFPVYAGDGYAIFLPDIRFEIGRPGFSATKCLVPGVQKLVDMGVADPDAIALHGHSWSGYQTAHVITQTDIFACAVAGAPVSNMTSAYGGIRYGTGLSRQFQYEMTQSRLGATLWERRDVYIDNSPLFFADRINTPLLMMFGDEDGAVPWTQGVELYMAMRRLEKPCVFLQYHGEPHHPQKYANKLDYSLRMKAFIDHFCKDEPAPQWWVEGEALEMDD